MLSAPGKLDSELDVERLAKTFLKQKLVMTLKSTMDCTFSSERKPRFVICRPGRYIITGADWGRNVGIP